MDNQVFIKRVWMPSGDIVSANLFYRDRPVLILDTGEEIVDNKSEITYEMTHEWIVDEKGETRQVPLSKPVRVYLTPRFMIQRKYSKDVKEEEQAIYPPSSNGFYGRLVGGKAYANYFVQRLQHEDSLWLSVIDLEAKKIHESHKIQLYENDVVRLKTYYEHFDELTAAFAPLKSKEVIDKVISILDTTELSWEDIYRLTEGLVPLTFKKGKNTRSTLTQLIPIEKFPLDTRDEILAFLVWVAKDLTPQEDIIEFLDSIHALPHFRSFYGNHLHFVMDGIKPPSYVNLVREATTGKTMDTKSLLEEGLKESSAFILRKKIRALAPVWQDEVIDIVKSLEKASEITTILPLPKITIKKQAKQRRRLIMYDMGLQLKAHVKPRSLGLRELVYIGAAHRWPHWHLAFSIRLGPSNIRSQYLQNMVMPPSAAEKVKRTLPSVIDIEWSSRIVNIQLYSKSKKKWNIRENTLVRSFEGNVSMKKLQAEFGAWKGNSPYIPTVKEARLLDMASTMFYLADLESEAGRKYWQTDGDTSRKMLTKLKQLGVIDIAYWFDRLPTLSRVFTWLQGPESMVCSTTRGIIKNTPTSLAMIADGGKTSLIISRIPTKEKENFERIVTLKSKDIGLESRCIFPPTLRNYTTDLYRRLLNSDGSWNDDISAFLSQVRSVPKNTV